MLKKIIIISLILSTYSVICYSIYNDNPISTKVKTNIITKINKTNTINKETNIGNIKIKAINLNQKLFPQNSKHNNIEENVTILNGSIEPDNDNSIFFLAAHSGTGRKAIFKNLDKLNINDEVELFYKDNSYTYIVNNIWETKKTGNISVPKENKNQLVLTTCSPSRDNYQLIINCIKK